MYLVLSVLYLSPGSVITASVQAQRTDVKVLPESGDDGQCPSMEERERARNEINIISNQVIVIVCPVATVHQDGGVLLLST